jgi:hypothetical protein
MSRRSYCCTIVSGYWAVKGKHPNDAFKSWFANTMSINCPYVFFGNQESIDMVKAVRGNLPTKYCLLEMDDFYTQKYRNHLAAHDIHVPSGEVCMIWLEKVFLLEKAKELNYYDSEYYLWVDAGICTYRDNPPPLGELSAEKILDLPRDKMIFTSSEEPYMADFVHENNYYHYISGTAFGCHKDYIGTFVEVYKTYLDRNIYFYNWVNTEQKILTQMYADHPEMFFKLGEGYGSLIPLLYPSASEALRSGCLMNPYTFL